MKKIRLGTRGSQLAVAQSSLVAQQIKKLCGVEEVELVPIVNKGDLAQGTLEAGNLDKKAWIDGLENAIAKGDIDFAVHSGKDLPAEINSETALISILNREDPSDCFIGKLDPETGKRFRFSELSVGDLVGTSSIRRSSQLKQAVPGIVTIDHRGNINTRMHKLDSSDSLKGIILASAGVNRLGMKAEIEKIAYDFMLPAVNQGILVAQYRKEDQLISEILRSISDKQVQQVFVAERRCIEILNADCKSAIGVLGEELEGQIKLSAKVIDPNSNVNIFVSKMAKMGEELLLGEQVAKELLVKGAKEFL